MTRITISYRRDDSGVITGRIFDRLAAHYGRDAVFRDIDNIPPGVDFRQHIAGVLGESDILLAIVGPRWLGPRGHRNRLDDDADPVRLEIETGLRKEMPVIPVLVMRAAMPRVDHLPDSVKDFAYRNAVQVDAGQDFDIHSARLIRAMDRILRQRRGLPDEPSDADDNSAFAEPALANLENHRLFDPPAEPVPAPSPTARRASGASPGPSSAARRGRAAALVAAGLVAGGLGAAAVVMSLRPPTPPDVARLTSANEEAETKVLTLRAELVATQKKLDTTQGGLEAAQKQATGAQEHAQTLQASLDQGEQNLAAQKSAAADVAVRLAQSQDQAKTLGEQLARSQAQAKTLDDQLAAEKKAHQAALDQAEKLGGQVKALQTQMGAAAVQPVTAGAAAPTVSDDSGWSADQRRQTQADLETVGYLQGTADGNFGPATRTAIKQFQSLADEAETGVMTDSEAAALRGMALRVSTLLARGETSPDGVSAAAVKGATQRYQRAWAAEKGSNGMADPAEAVYWYGLAAAEGYGKALINLGTLLIRGQGVAKSDPDGAMVLWEAAAARGEVTAMFNLGAMYEHGVGVPADSEKAKAWYRRAATGGDAAARDALKRLGA
jgi:TPR repeat protein